MADERVVSVALTDAQWARLRAAAEARGVTPEALAAEALNRACERRYRPAPKAGAIEALKGVR